MKETFFCSPQNTGGQTVTIFYQAISSVEWELEMGEIGLARVFIAGNNVAYILLREDARRLWNEINN